MVLSKIAHYEILDKIGEGGMGEVYRARDTRLQRQVALKILPDAFSQDAARIARFEREARAVAALSHPHVLAIHDFGQDQGRSYAVMELLSGETLRERMESSRIPFRKSLEYATQIAQGLAAAHSRGVVHRDLKPENVFLTHPTGLKILDFGLAKLSVIEGPSKDSLSRVQTRAVGSTEPGFIMGTVGYMSPEQVRGEAADHHPGVESILRRCLEKRPELRFQSTQDLAFALEAQFTGSGSQTSPPAATVGGSRRRGLSRTLIQLTSALLLLLLGLVLGRYWGEDPAPANSTVEYQRLTFRRGTVYTARFDPQGREVFYAAAWEGEPTRIFSTIPGTRASRDIGFSMADLLSLSSSGEMVLLFRDQTQDWEDYTEGTLATAPLSGGAQRQIEEEILHADWVPGTGELAIVRKFPDRLQVEYPIGKVLYQTTGLIDSLRASPDGKLLAFGEKPWGFGNSWSISFLTLEGDRRSFETGNRGDWIDLAWSPKGREVWWDLMLGSDTDLRAMTPEGESRLLAHPPIPLRILDVAADGRVLVSRTSSRFSVRGKRPGDDRERDYSWLDFSELDAVTPDGQTLLMTEFGEGGGFNSWSVFLRRTDGSPAVRLGEGQAFDLSPDRRWALTMILEAKSCADSAPDRRRAIA